MDSIRPSKFHPRYHRHSSGLWVGSRLSVGSYSAEVLADSPKFWVKLDEASGAFVDQMGGTTTNSNISARNFEKCRPGGNTGVKMANANNSWIEITPATSFDATLAQSWELWLKNVSGSGYVVIGGKDDSGGSQIPGYINASGSGAAFKTYFNIKNSANAVVAEPTTWDSTTGFHHIVWTTTGGTNPTVIGYHNGSQVVSGTATTTRINAGVIRLGASPDTFFTSALMSVSDFACYQSTLSPARVAAHYAAG